MYPDSVDTVVTLFHPRRDSWNKNFEWDGALLFGKTPTGRATIHVLAINSVERVELREELVDEGVEL